MQFSAPSLNGLAQLALSVLTGMRDAGIQCPHIVSTARNALRQQATTSRMSNMPTIHYETLPGTFEPCRRAVNAAA
jgi:hypothetical protein